MSALSGSDCLERPMSGSDDLAGRYVILLGLYSELESASDVVLRLIEQAASSTEVSMRLKEKMVVADRIIQESRGIAELKKTLAGRGGIDAGERELVIELETRLTQAVNRMVEQENRSRDLVMRRGVRVARR